MTYRMASEDFDVAVEEAIGRLPHDIRRLLDNVAIFVEAEPPPGDEELLGVYEGTPLPERDEAWAGVLPDRIVIFQGPLERLSTSRPELLREIGVTVAHEVGHYFGIDDARLHELGWG